MTTNKVVFEIVSATRRVTFTPPTVWVVEYSLDGYTYTDSFVIQSEYSMTTYSADLLTQRVCMWYSREIYEFLKGCMQVRR